MTDPLANDHIALDPTEEEDSTYDSTSSYATSLASSITKYPWEHGRRYHKYKEGSYPWPNDESEQDRLDLNHHVFMALLEGKLYLAPIKPGPLRVLDMGTGTGIWAIEMGDEHPEAELILGNDLSPIQPNWVPPNVKFMVDDLESDWVVTRPFDYIHGRYLAGSIGDWPKLMRQSYSNVKPGGWVEFQDYDLHMFCDDDTVPPDNKFRELHDLINQACEKRGRTAAPGPLLKGWVEQAGFKNIEEKAYKLPIGTWAKDERLKKAGGLNKLQCLDGLEAFTMQLFTSTYGWTAEEVQAFLVEVRRDATLKGIHPYVKFFIVWGQKPE